MKTMLIMSDTHGCLSNIEKLLPIIREADYVVHLGDYKRDIEPYKNEIKGNLISVFGNCDGLSNDEVFEVENVKILATHGSNYRVKSTLLDLVTEGERQQANLVLFGHTHKPESLLINNIRLINPGTLKGISPSYAYIVIDKDKIVDKIVNVNPF